MEETHAVIHVIVTQLILRPIDIIIISIGLKISWVIHKYVFLFDSICLYLGEDECEGDISWCLP